MVVVVANQAEEHIAAAFDVAAVLTSGTFGGDAPLEQAHDVLGRFLAREHGQTDAGGENRVEEGASVTGEEVARAGRRAAGVAVIAGDLVRFRAGRMSHAV